jgi:hypothetical protein
LVIHPGYHESHVLVSVASVLSEHFLITQEDVADASFPFVQYAPAYALQVSMFPVSFEQSVEVIHASFLLLIHPVFAALQLASVA